MTVAAPASRTSKSLFSQHFLDHRLPELPEWRVAPAPTLARLRALYTAKRDRLPQFNEAQTESEFVRPVLEILGFAYLPQTTASRTGRSQRPDYALFLDQDAKEAASSHVLNETAFYAYACAIADAKYWDRPLSAAGSPDSPDRFDNANPSFQMVSYLIGTGVDWGILTNGRIWRLYFRHADFKAGEYYQADLAEALDVGDLDAFRRFWLFFRAEAFRRDAAGRTFLQRVREESTTYAQSVGDDLKAVVFEHVFPLLAGGLVADGQDAGEDMGNPANLALTYEATLSLLYKVLFLLYAEARGLLPVDNAGYQQQSLTQLAQDVVHRLDAQQPLSTNSTAYYDRLMNLFRLVDQGDCAYGLPRYNGGLFHFDRSDREKYPANSFLLKHRIADHSLALALDRLYRTHGAPIDYGFLGVRHLGAIYEGLLENRLCVDDAARGSVHLETDKGERKASGSYYTPDYVVKYIVEHTVGPILAERETQFAGLMKQIGTVRKKLRDQAHERHTAVLRQDLDRMEREARETLLDVKVCDPAMGSGHFLVEAVDFLSDRLAQILIKHPDHNPVLAMLDGIRQDIVANLKAQGIAIDPGRLDDTQLLQRVVMKRCIYGVDLNPMAVELAKVGLWLHSFTVGAPLSFMDHHLRCGNSLIGATAREASTAMQATQQTRRLSQDARRTAKGRGEKTRESAIGIQDNIWGGPFAGMLQAAGVMRGISLLTDATLAQVEESSQRYDEFDRAARPYKQLLDVYLSRHFGVTQSEDFLRRYGHDELAATPPKVQAEDQWVLTEARRLFEERRFFHWDLEFPEIFIDLERATWKEDPGFDAVVGNPPYVRVRTLKANPDSSAQFFEQSRYYRSAVHVWDLYMLFAERALQLGREGGRCAFILPIQILHQPNALALRQAILDRSSVLEVIDLGQIRVFNEALVKTAILVYSVGSCNQSQSVLIQIAESESFASSNGTMVPGSLLRQPPDFSFKPDLLLSSALLAKVSVPGAALSAAFYATFGLRSCAPGKGAGGKDRLVLTSASTASARPYMEGREIARYESQWAGRYLNYLPDQMYSPRSADLFEQPKLVSRSMLSEKRFVATFDTQGLYVEQSLVCIVPCHATGNSEDALNPLFLLALLNSTLLGFYFARRVIGDSLGGGMIHATPGAHAQLPIRRIPLVTSHETRATLLTSATTLFSDYLSTCDPASLLSFVDQRLLAQPEQADVVHDLLSHLAQQMIDLNKEKQAETKGFLNWLTGHIGAPLETLTGRTRLTGYLGDYQKNEGPLAFQDVMAILKANGRRLNGNPCARAFQEPLEQEYQRSLDRLLPIKARLSRTDRLIDLVVYRLYGLSDDDIRIVEGR